MFASITLMGNLGKDPEIKRLTNGATTARFSVAVDQGYKGKDGNKIEKTMWLDVEAYQAKDTGIVTNLIQKYLKKGQTVMIVAEPTIEHWEKDGVKQRAFRVKLGPTSTLKMIGRPKGSTGTDAEPAANGSGIPSSVADDSIPF